MFESILEHFRPKVLADLPSKYNGRVIVKQGFGYRYIHTSDAYVTQSGGIVEDVWRPVLVKLAKKYRLRTKNWLILGLAGGTLPAMLAKKYSPASMTAVEIDPVMISAGKKYFLTDKIKRLAIIRADAKSYVQRVKESFDFVLVDLYIGEKLPTFIYTKKFLAQLKKIAPVVVVNHMFYNSDNKAAAGNLVHKLSKIFPKVELVRSLANLLIICQSQV